MRKERDNTRRIGGLLLDALMMSFIVSFSFADVRIVDVYSTTTREINESNDDLIMVKELDALCNSFLKQISQAQPPHVLSVGPALKSPLLAIAGLVTVTGTQCSYNAIYTHTTINAP